MQQYSSTGEGSCEALIIACSESVKGLAWKFARSSDGRVDVDEMYSVGMVGICECVVAGRLANAENPMAYLYGAARFAMIEEWRRLHECSTVSLDAPLSDDRSNGFCLADTLSDGSFSSASASSKRVRALHGAMRRLSFARQRAALRRRYGMEGYGAHNLEEAARALRASKDAAKCLDQRGRHNLARDARLCKVMGVEVEQ